MSTSERRALHTGIERRSTPFRLADGGGMVSRGAGSALDGWTLAAHASVVGVPYVVNDKYGQFQETVHPGSFRDTISRGADVHLLTNHQGLSLGRTKSGTLRLSEDGRGLRYEADLDPSNPNAQALRSAVMRGDISQSSFSFKVTRDQWSKDFDRRDIFAVDLNGGDVSPVNAGANPATGDGGSATTLRAQLSGAQLNDLADSAWAFIEPGGKKDSAGKTTPRRLRHFCIVDAPHVRAALARVAGGAAFSKEALPAVLKAAKKFGVHVSEANAAAMLSEVRSPLHAKFQGTHSHRHPAFGSQGGDATHSHEHVHGGDSGHQHHDDGSDNDDVSTETMGTTSSLALDDWDFEARVRIARLKADDLCPPPLTAEQRQNIAEYEAERTIEKWRKRIQELNEEGS
jgi:HK97 family phage prohead protease